MKDMKLVCMWLLLSIPLCHAVTVADVQNLKTTTFFSEWSKFLDQVLKAQQEPIAPENDKIYRAFIQQAKKLNIPKVTGNKGSISAMQEQMKLLQKRIKDEKNLAGELKQLSETVMNAQQPVSVENQDKYKELIKHAKDVGIEKPKLDEMEAKMNEAKGKFGAAAPVAPQEPIFAHGQGMVPPPPASDISDIKDK